MGDGRGTYATFERGNIYASTTTGGFEVHGAVLTAYLGTYGGPQGSLGYPLSELDPAGTAAAASSGSRAAPAVHQRRNRRPRP